MEKLRKNKGITLVALVITIIILLILAGISIQAITNTGLFANTKRAKEKSMEGQLKEEISLAIQDIEVEEISKGNGVTLETLAGGQLENKLKDITAELDDDKINGEYSGYEYTIDSKFNVKIENQEDLIFYARKLQEQGAINVLVSLGKDGAILVSEDNHVYYCAGAKGKLLNSVGSGDSMVAGFIAGYLKEKKYDEALKLGSACGGATAFSEDLAEASMIQEVYKQLKVEEL